MCVVYSILGGSCVGAVDNTSATWYWYALYRSMNDIYRSACAYEKLDPLISPLHSFKQQLISYIFLCDDYLL